LQGRQGIEGFARQAVILGKEGGEEIPEAGTALAALWPTDKNLLIPSVQKDFNVGATFIGRVLEGALAPVVEPEERRLDMFAGAQAVDAVIGAVTAVDGFSQRTDFDTIHLPAIGMDPVVTEKSVVPRQGFNPEGFIDPARTTSFYLIGITCEPTRWLGLSMNILFEFLCL